MFLLPSRYGTLMGSAYNLVVPQVGCVSIHRYRVCNSPGNLSRLIFRWMIKSIIPSACIVCTNSSHLWFFISITWISVYVWHLNLPQARKGRTEWTFGLLKRMEASWEEDWTSEQRRVEEKSAHTPVLRIPVTNLLTNSIIPPDSFQKLGETRWEAGSVGYHQWHINGKCIYW